MHTSASASAHILIVDDEPAVRSVLRCGLEAEGFVVSEVGNAAELLRRIETDPVSLITLDLGLPDCEGLALVRRIRAKRNVPIIMITAWATPVDRASGLDHGADDYIVKPFLVREVLARVRSVLHRHELERRTRETAEGSGSAAECYAFDTGVLDMGRREVTAAGAPLPLTDREFALLAIFLTHPAEVLSRDRFMHLLKGQPWSPMDRTIDGHVARLRRKIEPNADNPRLIRSVRGIGYVFTGNVRRVERTSCGRVARQPSALASV